MYLSTPTSPFSLDDPYSIYECPSIFDKKGNLKPQSLIDKELHAWIKISIEEGNAFLKSCRAYSSIQNVLNNFFREVNYKLDGKISQVWVNNTKRNLKELAAILSNIRPSWQYEANSAKDKSWLVQARIQNGLSDDWYNESNVDLTLKSLIELGSVEGTGYISPIWNPELNNNEGGIELKLYRYNEYLPIQLGRDFDIQRAYGGILIDEMPINRARKLFPHKRHLLIPDRGETRMARDTIISSAINKVKGFYDSIADGNRERRKTYPSPVVDIFYTYVNDFSINPTNQPIPMGEHSWAYTVPSIGQNFPTGRYNLDGSKELRKATSKDCLLYPNKRLIISSRTCILYDGPSYWWHRKIPVAKYSPDEWIFSFLGFSMASEVISLDVAANKMRRDIEDALHLKVDPPMQVDKIAASKTEAKSTTLRSPGKRWMGNLAMGDIAKPLIPPESYNVGTDHFLFVEKTEDTLKNILGIPDLKSLQQARQIPASDTISQFFAQAGAIVTSMSRTLDPVMKFIADCNRYYFYQFYDLPRRIKILGEQGVDKNDFDFEPATLVPQSLPNEILNSNNLYESTRFERAKQHLSNFRTTIQATSLHQITHMQHKLLLMQATKIYPGFPAIDPGTMMKELDVPGWGSYEGDTGREKVTEFLKEQLGFQLLAQEEQAKLQMKIQMMMQMMTPEGMLANALGSAVQEASSEGSNGLNGTNGKTIMKNSPGRPPEFQEAPDLKYKPSEQRTTITG